MKFRIFLVIFIGVIIGCGQPKIDTSSDEAMKASIEKVRKSLPENDRDKFDKAVMRLAFKNFSLENAMAGEVGKNITEIKMKEAINGKTGPEIIAEAEILMKKDREQEKKDKAERDARLQELTTQRKKMINDQISELVQKKEESERAILELANFVVSNAKFYKEKQHYSDRDEPVIELDVENLTKHSVSDAYFKATLISPGRDVPWVEKSFRHSISGGLLPDEIALWKFTPGSFSDFGNKDIPLDAKLFVEVTRIDGEEGMLFSTEGFSKWDKDRLDDLRAELAKINAQ